MLLTMMCPYRGEPIDIYVDPGGGELQDYIEDCAVCCRPILFSATLDESTGDFDVEASDEV